MTASGSDNKSAPANKPLSRSQKPAPATFLVGCRALAPHQSIALTCTDGTVNDNYSFTVVGSDGVSHFHAFDVVANPGTAVAPTLVQV